jgi:hypothetical protein
MGTKSREVIYGGQVRAAKMNADRARKFAVEAAREADRAEADAWSCRMEGFGGALAATVTGLIVQTTGSFVPALVVVRTDRRGVGGFPLFVVDQPITAVDMDAMSPSGGYSFEGRRDQYRRWFTNQRWGGWWGEGIFCADYSKKAGRDWHHHSHALRHRSMGQGDDRLPG